MKELPLEITREDFVDICLCMLPGEHIEIFTCYCDNFPVGEQLSISHGIECVQTWMREECEDKRTWVFDFYGGGTPYVFSAVDDNEPNIRYDMQLLFVDFGIYQKSDHFYLDLSDPNTEDIYERVKEKRYE